MPILLSGMIRPFINTAATASVPGSGDPGAYGIFFSGEEI